MSDARLRELERRARTTDDPLELRQLARELARCGFDSWRNAEETWAEEPTPENLERLAQLAAEVMPPAVVLRVVSRPMKGQRVSTRHGRGVILGNARNAQGVPLDGRQVALDQGNRLVNIPERSSHTRVLNPVSWLLEHPNGQRWAREKVCSKCQPWGTARKGEWCDGCNPPGVCLDCGGIAFRTWRPAASTPGELGTLHHRSFCGSPAERQKRTEHARAQMRMFA